MVRFFRLKGVPLRYFANAFENSLGVVGKVHHHNILLALMAAIQSGQRLYRIAIHYRFIEEHTGEQRLVKTCLELIGNNHQPIVVTLEALLYQLSVLQVIHRMFTDCRIGFRMDKIRKSIEHLVV